MNDKEHILEFLISERDKLSRAIEALGAPASVGPICQGCPGNCRQRWPWRFPPSWEKQAHNSLIIEDEGGLGEAKEGRVGLAI